MSWLPIVGGALGLINAFSGAGQQQAAGQAQSSIDNELVNIYNQLLQDYNQNYLPLQGDTSSMLQQLLPILNIPGTTQTGLNYWLGQAATGLDPAVTGAAESGLATQGAQTLASMLNSLGPSTPNKAGMAQQFGEQMLQSQEALQGNLAAQNQGIRNQAMTNAQQTSLGPLGMILQFLQGGSSLLPTAASGLGQLGAQYGQEAQATPQNNPLSFLSSFLTNPANSNALGLGATAAAPAAGAGAAAGGIIPGFLGF
jgi:hypothetical protein